MAIRESERSALLGAGHMANYGSLLASARKFAEGFSVVFDVTTHSSYDHCSRFVSWIIAARR